MTHDASLEHKFARFGERLAMDGEARIEGYASLFGQADQAVTLSSPALCGLSGGWRWAGENALAA